MRGSRHGPVLAGAGLMALRAVGPLAHVSPSGIASTEQGNGFVLLAAGLVVLLELSGRGRGARRVGALFAAWIVLGMYTLPGDLVGQGASEATIAWGAYLAALGALLVAVAAGPPSGSTRAPVRRATLPIVCLVIACGLVSIAWTSPRADSTWAHHARDDFSVESADGSARAVAAIEWFHRPFPAGLQHRGVFTHGSVLEAVRPVACLWAKVEWGFALGAAGMPGSRYIVHCRRPGARKPPPISLAGHRYTRTLLNSVMVTLCVSNAKAYGPRSCGAQKFTYSPV